MELDSNDEDLDHNAKKVTNCKSDSSKRKNRDYYVNEEDNEMMDFENNLDNNDDSNGNRLGPERQQQQSKRNGNDFHSCENAKNSSKRGYIVEEEPVDRLERYGQWLLSVPRDDVFSLQRTPEYTCFVRAFEELEKAHLVLHKCPLPKPLSHENSMLSHDSTKEQSASQQQSSTKSQSQQKHSSSIPRQSNYDRNINTENRQLGGLLVDDVILRIFEFLNCKSLVQLSQTCHRYRILAQLSARQQTSPESSAMKLLRAKEQSRGIDPTTPPFVEIPMLGLPRRVYVHGASDEELNGIYFCTGTNGNGFIFTKPRNNTYDQSQNNMKNSQANNPTNNTNIANANGATNIRTQTTLNPANITIHPRPDHNPPPQPHPQLFHNHHHQQQHRHHDPNNLRRIIPDPQPNNREETNQTNNITFNNVNNFRQSQQYQSPKQRTQSNNLKCIIAKRFSNETLLWYLSKEKQEENGQITQVFSFWARLMIIGDAEPELCRYPSMTSVLSRNGDPAWQPLSTTRTMTPPCVELLD